MNGARRLNVGQAWTVGPAKRLNESGRAFVHAATTARVNRIIVPTPMLTLCPLKIGHASVFPVLASQ